MTFKYEMTLTCLEIIQERLITEEKNISQTLDLQLCSFLCFIRSLCTNCIENEEFTEEFMRKNFRGAS